MLFERLYVHIILIHYHNHKHLLLCYSSDYLPIADDSLVSHIQKKKKKKLAYVRVAY